MGDYNQRSVDDVTSTAQCSSGFAWMNNMEGQSPCLVTAYVLGTCSGNNWMVPPLLPDSHYNPPNISTDTTNPCSCSWSAYNLYSACTECQGQNSSVLTWGAYIAECPSSNTNSYFPSGYTLSSNSSIPFWAATNPNDWSNVIFNADQAQVLANEGHADLSPTDKSNTTTSSSSGHSSLVGPIIGGVVGAVAVLVIVGVVGFMVYRHRKNRGELVAQVGSRSNEDMIPRPQSQTDMSIMLPYMRRASDSYSSFMSESAVSLHQQYPSHVGYYSVTARTTSPFSVVSTATEGVPIV